MTRQSYSDFELVQVTSGKLILSILSIVALIAFYQTNRVISFDRNALCEYPYRFSVELEFSADEVLASVVSNEVGGA